MKNIPLDSEVEVTLIGTGGGYGESVVLKVGIDSWIIIDSCRNPNSREILSIEYLNSIGVDLSKVVLIVCTHWHDDHIKGLSECLSLCPKAEFAFSAVNDLKKFLLLCGLDATKSSKGSISSTSEFAKCLDIISSRGEPHLKVSSDMIFFKHIDLDETFKLVALSPSPKTVNDFDSEISELITEFGKRNTAVIKKSPNEKSVAMLLQFGSHRVVLGADLEIGKNDFEGWRYVTKHSKVLDSNKASLYKVPHHGSENAYLSDIFDVLVNKESVLKMTPFSASRLPRDEMLSVYSGHSESVFITSNINVSKKAKKRDNSIEKFIDKCVVSLVEVKFSHGIIRSRINYKEKDAIWKTETFLAAYKLKN